jgi:uncharacterized protein (DUF1499 family)
MLLAVLIAARVATAFVWPTINDVKTGATPQYADLQAQHFTQPYDRVFDAALATAESSGWQIARTDREHGAIEAVAITTLWRFKDDVAITVGHADAGAVVDVRSHSRIGKGDFGTNARRIRRFQGELASRLGSSPPP